MDCVASRSAAETGCASPATCLTASPRSQQELRLKPTTSRTQNQRGQLPRVQIVVVDRRTRSASRKERPAAPRDLSIRSATRYRQGLSQLLPVVSGNVRTCQCLTRQRAAFDSSTVSGRLLLTKSEAAEQLGVSLRTIERLISAGHLPLVHVAGAARVRVADLGAYVQGLDADHRTSPSPVTTNDRAIQP